MRRIVWLACFLFVALHLYAQESCSDGEALEARLNAAPTCEKAAAIMKDCAWGSSADSGFSRIVVKKCESNFLEQLSLAAKKRYAQELNICWKTEALQVGTLYISLAALCTVDVAKEYATNPARRSDAPLQAGFDCKKASTPLELAICSDAVLGEEDVILSRVYTQVRNDLKNKSLLPVLRDNQRAWLQTLPGVCRLSEPATQNALQCLRKEEQVRYSLLNTCLEDDASSKEQMLSCLHDRSVLR